jgi:Mn-dependent DtxR family transcriptional regulator
MPQRPVKQPLKTIAALTQPVSTVDVANALGVDDALAAMIIRSLAEAALAKLETDGRWTVTIPWEQTSP